jgi:hypothetical protein
VKSFARFWRLMAVFMIFSLTDFFSCLSVALNLLPNDSGKVFLIGQLRVEFFVCRKAVRQRAEVQEKQSSLLHRSKE